MSQLKFAGSVHFSPLPSKILSDRRWALLPKSARNPLNGQSMIPLLRIYFPAPTTPLCCWHSFMALYYIFKELFAIMVAVTIWSMFLQSCKIIFHCDNQSVVHILNSGTSRCHRIMSLIHYLFYVCCKCHSAHTQAQKLTHCCFMSIAGGPISRTGSSRGGLIHPSTSLRLSKLKVRAEHYFHRGLTSTTHRTYSSAQCQYWIFCDTHNLTALPGDENTILFFITDLANILVVAH